MKQFFKFLALGFICLAVHAGESESQAVPASNAFETEANQLLVLEEIDENMAVKTQVKNETQVKAKKLYASVLLGIGAYPEVSNIDKGYNVSAAAGYFVREQLMLEAGVGMAKSQLSIKNQLNASQRDSFDINQYQANLAAKYRLDGLFGTRLMPQFGLAMSYTYRKYSLTNNTILVSGNTGSSNAFDAGVGGGLDYELSPSFALGVDFRYMFNLSNQVSANYINPNYGYIGTSLETLQYYVAGVTARMNF